jgi:transposase-like protein
MSKRKRRVFSREFKLSAVQRMIAGESTAELSRELGVPNGHLYRWCAHFRRGGAEALRPACRPRKIPGAVELAPEAKAMRVQDVATARKRISELERKIGQQQVELDFFRQALRQVGGARQPSDGLGVRASTRSSRR